MSLWLSWISIFINAIILIVSIQVLFKFYTSIVKNVERNSKKINLNQQQKSINDQNTYCVQCKCILNKTISSSAKNYHNKEQAWYEINDESYERCDSENQLYNISSSDDEYYNVTDEMSIDENVIKEKNEKNQILEICRQRNTVSKLRKQFENDNRNKSKIRNFEKKLSERFFKCETSIKNSSLSEVIPSDEDQDQLNIILDDTQENNENTTICEVVNNNNNNNNVVQNSTINKDDNIYKFRLSKRSHSSGEIKRKLSSQNVIVEEPILNSRSNSDNFLNNDFYDVEYRRTAAIIQRRSVRTFDDILQQERFSKCYSEYSISDLVNDIHDEDDVEITEFFNKIK